MKKILLALFITVGLVGCGNQSNAISLEEAEDIALKEVDGDIINSTQETDDGRIYFEIDVLKDSTLHELELNSKGKITSHEKEKNYAVGKSNSQSSTESSSNTTATAATISAEEANNIALARVGGGNITKNELDTDDGVLRYEIEIIFNNMEYDVKVNATSGEIIAFDQDTI